MSKYEEKLEEFIFKDIQFSKNLNILEFGVRFGESTKRFISHIEKNGGHLYSVDIDDYSNISSSEKWTFLKCRDDNFEFIEKKIPEKFDLIYFDSFHDAKHMEKIFYYYFKKLKINGLYVVDDISHLPYIKGKKRNSFNCEINNKETFLKILEILNANSETLKVYFSFNESGLAKIQKCSEASLNYPKKIFSRTLSLKNLIRKIFLNK
tara:strand:+ start:841 stop:1464 length:624 start_codon:yes stop_codon:yes gene_type:complete